MSYGDIWRGWPEAEWVQMWANRPEMHKRIMKLALHPDSLDVSVLEIGCGYGYMRKLLIDQGHTGEYLGIDINPHGVSRIITGGGKAICGNFMDRDDLLPVDLVIIEGVLDHQAHWQHMTLKALALAPKVIVGLQRWSGKNVHDSEWVEDGGYYNTYYSRQLFESEANELGLIYEIQEFVNPIRRRMEVVIDIERISDGDAT